LPFSFSDRIYLARKDCRTPNEPQRAGPLGAGMSDGPPAFPQPVAGFRALDALKEQANVAPQKKRQAADGGAVLPIQVKGLEQMRDSASIPYCHIQNAAIGRGGKPGVLQRH